MALFRKPRRHRATESKAARREAKPAHTPAPPLLEQLQAIAASVHTPEDALEPALRAIVEATGAAGGALCLFDQRHSVLRLTAETGLSDEGCRRLRTIRRADPSCWDIPLHGVVNRRAYLIENASENRYVPPLVGTNPGMRTIACIPVYSGLSALASVILVSAPPRAFAERDITLLWKPLRELAGMIEAVRRQVGPADPAGDAPTPPLDLFTLTAERDRLRADLAGRAAEFERLALQLTTNRDEATRLRADLDEAIAARGEIARELERVRAQSEETAALAAALGEAERERQRLVEALETAAQEAEAREGRALETARREAETAQLAREAEWVAARRTHAEQVASATRLAEERSAEVARLTTRLSEIETGSVADRGRDSRREGEIARLTAALEAAAGRETDLRARLAAREADRVNSADAELTAAREALTLAEAGRGRAEERATTLDAELQSLRTALDDAHAELARAREEIGQLRETARGAVDESARHQTALAEAQSLEAEVRARLETADRVLVEVTAARDRANEEARGYQSGIAHAEARLEAIAAERDQLREALARSEAECARLRTALDSAQSEDARVGALLAQERTEQAELAQRLAAAEAAVAGLEAVTTEQRAELVEREAEIVRLTAEHAELLAQRDQILADRVVPETTTIAVDTADLEAAALLSPDMPATLTRPDAGVTVIAVQSPEAEHEFVPTGAPVVVVIDGDPIWSRIGIEGHDVAVIKPGASSVSRMTELEPVRVIANLAAPGALTALLALRAAGSTARLWGCVADPATDRAIALSAIQPVVGPIDPDTIIAALGPFAGRDGRIVTTGADVDALMSLRQALSRRRASVSMAWDAKQARELLGVVRPHAVVVDLSMPKRDGCAIVAAVAALDPIPLVVLVTSAGDVGADFSLLLADPPRDTVVQTLRQVVRTLSSAGEEHLPSLSSKPVVRLQVAQGPRWVG
jgi:CheY-like chemotaxis protein